MLIDQLLVDGHRIATQTQLGFMNERWGLHSEAPEADGLRGTPANSQGAAATKLFERGTGCPCVVRVGNTALLLPKALALPLAGGFCAIALIRDLWPASRPRLAICASSR